MISNADTNEIFSGLRKAAIAIVTLGDEVAAEVFRFLNEEEIQSLGREISKLSKVSPEQAERVLQEFHEMSMVSVSPRVSTIPAAATTSRRNFSISSGVRATRTNSRTLETTNFQTSRTVTRLALAAASSQALSMPRAAAP